MSFFLKQVDSFEDMPPGLHPNPNRNPAHDAALLGRAAFAA